MCVTGGIINHFESETLSTIYFFNSFKSDSVMLSFLKTSEIEDFLNHGVQLHLHSD